MVSPLENTPKQMLHTSAVGFFFGRLRLVRESILCVRVLIFSRMRRMISNAVTVPQAAAANNIDTMHSGYTNSNKSYLFLSFQKMFRNVTKHFRTRCLNTYENILEVQSLTPYKKNIWPYENISHFDAERRISPASKEHPHP